MFIVAMAALGGVVDATKTNLAKALGTTLYELRLALSGGFPAVVLTTPELSRAEAAANAIDSEGGRGVLTEREAVFPSSRMVALRDFRFERAGVTPTPDGDLLPFSDIFALFRATHTTVTNTSQMVTERKLDAGMAIVTGGLKLSRSTSREVVSHSDDREQVLYIFRHSGAPPWILHERSAHYAGLGEALGPSSIGNFQETIRALRQHAPDAAYDDRFLVHRPIRAILDGIESADILVHLLALSLGYQPGR